MKIAKHLFVLNMTKITIAIFAVSALSMPAAAKSLTGDELKVAFSGKRLKFETPNGFKGSTVYKKNGQATLTITKPERSRDKGKWWIKGNKICNQWEVVRGGQPKCTKMKQTGRKQYVNDDGTVIKTN